MSWKRYQNELIVVGAVCIMLGSYMYKHKQVTLQTEQVQGVKHSLEELKEVVALKKIWADNRTTKKVEQLGTLVAPSKVKWSKKSKKVTASYVNLSANELNTVTTKILNLPVEIRLLDIKKTGIAYNVEFKCKW